MTLTWILLQSSLWGIVRGGLSFAMEHPLDVIKTYWQANPHIMSWRVLAHEIYRQKGWRGFYAGWVANTLRVMLKHAYRTPLMLFCHYLVMLLWREEAPIIVGVTIAFLEIGIVQPLERIKVWIMTSPYATRSLRRFIEEKQHKTLYQGFSASWPKQVVSWVVFLWVDNILRHYWQSHPDLPGNPLVVIPLLVGVANTLAILPLDAIKTHMQRYHADARLSWWQTLQMISRQFGWRGFYVGFGPRLLQYSIQALWTMPILYSLLPHIQALVART